MILLGCTYIYTSCSFFRKNNLVQNFYFQLDEIGETSNRNESLEEVFTVNNQNIEIKEIVEVSMEKDKSKTLPKESDGKEETLTEYLNATVSQTSQPH